VVQNLLSKKDFAHHSRRAQLSLSSLSSFTTGLCLLFNLLTILLGSEFLTQKMTLYIFNLAETLLLLKVWEKYRVL